MTVQRRSIWSVDISEMVKMKQNSHQTRTDRTREKKKIDEWITQQQQMAILSVNENFEMQHSDRFDSSNKTNMIFNVNDFLFATWKLEMIINFLIHWFD